MKRLPLDWIATSLTLIGLYLNAELITFCWVVWMASNFFWIMHWYVSYLRGSRLEVAQLVLNSALFWINVYGLMSWMAPP
jgi:hypothetical protein